MATLLDRQGRIDAVRFFLNVDSNSLPDTAIDFFLDRYEDKFGADLEFQCQVIYWTCIDCLNWLLKKYYAAIGNDPGSVTSRREKIGDEEIEVRYSTDSSTATGWEQLLQDLLDNPEYVCPELGELYAISPIIIGGVRKDQYKITKNDPNAVDIYETGKIPGIGATKISSVNPLIME